MRALPLLFALVVAGAPAISTNAAELQVGAALELSELRFGRSVLTPVEGTQLRALVSGGEVVGVLADGPCRYRMTVDDRFSVPVAERNVDRVGGAKLLPGDPPSFAADLDGVAVWLSIPPAGAAGTQLEAAPTWLVDTLGARLFDGPATTLAPQRAGQPAAWALLASKTDRWLAVVDPTLGVETLEALRRYKSALITTAFADQWIPLGLVRQPIARQWWEEAERSWTVRETSISIVDHGGEDGTISTRIAFEANQSGRSAVVADLRLSALERERLVSIKVQKVEVDGKPATWHRGVDTLIVELGRVVSAGEKVALEIETSGRQLQNPNGSSYWWLRPMPWYPWIRGAVVDGPAQIAIDVPNETVPFASGIETSRRREGGRTHVVTRTSWPGRYLVAAAGKFRLLEDDRDGFQARIGTYVFGKEREARRLLENFHAIRPFFEQITGAPYPFGELTLVEVDVWGLGQAPAGLIFLSHEAFGTLGDDTSRFFSQGVNERFMHEIAHQWWGNLVSGTAPEENWLSESFAEYFAALALQAAHGGKAGEAAFKRAVKTWKGSASQVKGGASVYLAEHLTIEESVDAFDRTALLYGKGPLVLEALRQELRRKHGADRGDVIFFAWLKSIVKNFQYRPVSTKHLVGILDQITQESWQPWFERYVYGTEMPKVD